VAEADHPRVTVSDEKVRDAKVLSREQSLLSGGSRNVLGCASTLNGENSRSISLNPLHPAGGLM
jgi:hypothetical protein